MFWSTARKLAIAIAIVRLFWVLFIFIFNFVLFLFNFQCSLRSAAYNGLHELVIVALSLSVSLLAMAGTLWLLILLWLLLLVLYNTDETLMVWLIVYYPRSSSRAANRVRNELTIKFHQPAANPSGRYKELSLPILSSSNFFLAIFEYSISIGCDWSYKLGACNIISAVPTTQAIAKIHRNIRSNTMATYFQSSSTCQRK